MRYDYECSKCRNLQEEIHGMLEHPVIVCESCGNECFKLISGNMEFIGVNGRNDMYQFTETKTTGKPLTFNGRRQWKEHLKRIGQHDDVKNDPINKSDIQSIKQRELRRKEENRKKIKESVENVVRNIPSSVLRERAKKVIRKEVSHGR